jgi:beta-glucosidase
LSYTNFTYSNFKINKQQFTKKDTITFSVDVTNSGNAVGKEVVQLFISDLVASLNPAVKNLKGFDKISLNVGQTKTVVIKVPVYQLAFVGIDNKWVVEAGEFSAAIADKTIKFEVK